MWVSFSFYILYHIIVGNLVTCARWGRFTVIHSVSSLAEIINNRQKARRSAGLHILMLVCIGSVFREGLALCWLCPDIHSHTISGSGKKKKGMHHTALLHMDQRGVCHAAVGLLERLPTWKYHIPVLCGGPVCNCVLSDLQSPSHSFLPDIFLQWIYFSFFLVFWQRVHSWPNLDLFFFCCFSHHACRQPMIKQCVEIALCMKKKENKKSQEKVTSNDWWTGKRTGVLSVHDSLFSIRLAAKRWKWPRNSRRSQISDSSTESSYHEAFVCDRPKPGRTCSVSDIDFTLKVTRADADALNASNRIQYGTAA